MNDATKPDSISLQYYVVGFFDLLGQQEILRSIRALPDRNDEAALAKTRDALKNTYGAVSQMRMSFFDAFNAYKRKASVASHLTPEQQKIYGQMDNNPIQSQSFSDSIVVFQSLSTNSDAKVPVRGILGILIASALTFVHSLSVGHPIRGGIDVGVGFQPKDNEIYGPALARAYDLESRTANYPRIIVGDELIRYFTALTSNQSTDILATHSRNVAKECAQCMAYDDDGIPFVDYLGPYFRTHIADNAYYVSFIDKAYNYILESSSRNKKEKNSKLAFRYKLLRNYFEASLPLWSDAPRSKEVK
jgi:hypothetical protein